VHTGPYTAVREVTPLLADQRRKTERFEVSIGKPDRKGFGRMIRFPLVAQCAPRWCDSDDPAPVQLHPRDKPPIVCILPLTKPSKSRISASTTVSTTSTRPLPLFFCSQLFQILEPERLPVISKNQGIPGGLYSAGSKRHAGITNLILVIILI
jgi:hypothetical protein